MSRYTRARAGDLATVGERLKLERLRIAYDIAEIADAAAVDKAVWGRWERDIGDPCIRISGWQTLARLGVDVQFVIVGKRAPSLNFVWRYLAEMSIRQSLEEMSADHRRLLLIDLLREEVGE